ncbi:peptidyl-prolyl cis-trans isomerase [Albimonas pacifica]|uniref:Parvulin-like PPIase n=1 Tax=Albimonas pacifica TaxID=1114924 RepID=A0A1I3DGP8_9RHOB|nr:peptidylprolyl isomerase [Albimonas pacifica]SFH85661.1 PPIC-type PPIASE domain-containing protein [Albimonas pacifica]
MLRTFLREPLVHFLAAGGLLFAAWSWVAPEGEVEADPSVVVLDQARLDHLTTLWRAQWRRDPAPADLEAIVSRHLRQEVFYREAVAMGLDLDDDIIRTRLAQKMEAVAADLGALMQPPTEDQLRAFHASRPDLFSLPPAIAFQQVLYLPAEADAERLSQVLAALQAGEAPPADRRNKLSIPFDWPLTPAQSLDNAFGGGFAESLAEMPAGEWAGPVRSGLGLHLVRVAERQPARLAPYEAVQELVARQFDYYAVLQSQDRLFQELLARYEVRIEAEGVPEATRRAFARP